jgi:transposase-like protein
MKISENMEFGTDDEIALTKEIENMFPSAARYLCTKHLKDNVKHYLQNKTGIEIKQRNI